MLQMKGSTLPPSLQSIMRVAGPILVHYLCTNTKEDSTPITIVQYEEGGYVLAVLLPSVPLCHPVVSILMTVETNLRNWMVRRATHLKICAAPPQLQSMALAS